MLGIDAVAESSRSAPKNRGAIKHPVFGIYERDGSVYTELITEDSLAKTLRAVTRGKISPESVVRSEGWKGYDGLVDVGHNKHFRIGKTEKSAQIDVIEAFWSFTKRRLAKFNGTQRNFDLHLHECEWRYNRSLPQLLADINLLLAKNKDLMV
jgi:transposase-like protein